MKLTLARILDRLGSWCFDLSLRLDPDESQATGTDAIVEAIRQTTRRPTPAQVVAQTAVRIVEATNRSVYVAPSWAVHDRHAFVVDVFGKTPRDA